MPGASEGTLLHRQVLALEHKVPGGLAKQPWTKVLGTAAHLYGQSCRGGRTASPASPLAALSQAREYVQAMRHSLLLDTSYAS